MGGEAGVEAGIGSWRGGESNDLGCIVGGNSMMELTVNFAINAIHTTPSYPKSGSAISFRHPYVYRG